MSTCASESSTAAKNKLKRASLSTTSTKLERLSEQAEIKIIAVNPIKPLKSKVSVSKLEGPRTVSAGYLDERKTGKVEIVKSKKDEDSQPGKADSLSEDNLTSQTASEKVS